MDRVSRRRLLEKCKRKYSPINCAKSSNLQLLEVFDDYPSEPKSFLPTLKPRRPKPLEPLTPSPIRNQTPDFPGREEAQDMIHVKDRNFTVKLLKVGRSITPDSLTATTQYSSNLLLSTSARSPHLMQFSSPHSGESSYREELKGAELSAGTYLSSETPSPVLEPRYVTASVQPVQSFPKARKSPRLIDLMTMMRAYDRATLPAHESPHNKDFFLKPQQEVADFLRFLPEMPGERLKFTTVTHYLRARKYLSKGEFIDKEAVQKCLAQKADISMFISKRLGKPRIWHHSSRALSTRFENQLKSYWH